MSEDCKSRSHAASNTEQCKASAILQMSGPKVVRLSKTFRSFRFRFEEAEKAQTLLSRSHRLLLHQGWISQSGLAGHYALGGELLRALHKLQAVVSAEMEAEGAQRVQLPLLSQRALWEKCGRLSALQSELYQLEDRHSEALVLAPTFEEAVTDFLAHKGLGLGQYPLSLYQVGPKFRDEMRPKFGLQRSKEFLMKDAYSFDVGPDEAKETYHRFLQAYRRVFRKLGVETLEVNAENGEMGGDESREFHIPASAGQDTLHRCESCQTAQMPQPSRNFLCSSCGGRKFSAVETTEVGHAFLLGDKYSAPLGLRTPKGPVHMGCYGIGLGRLLSACVDLLSSEDAIRFPDVLAPFRILVIGPKQGSREEGAAQLDMEELASALAAAPALHGEVVLDDRLKMSVGRRLLEGSRRGFPLVVLGNKSVCEETPRLEVFADGASQPLLLTHAELFQLLRQKWPGDL